MPSLDGYSLNEKINKVRGEVEKEINDMKMAFGQLYNMLKEMEEKPANCKKCKPAKAKSKAKKGAKNA